ncbi:hypothetical protein L332_08775 [Agrococcus pavilionensis RW1]|uniref:Uncharacterized protein n=1 Tax=Agrococcus pavilionensis RW1 TaxID=1330458 RepID=U1MV55_9MICO|nr:hypothetical protein L332_08775 [Agrococcus pavilionensis RW1]
MSAATSAIAPTPIQCRRAPASASSSAGTKSQSTNWGDPTLFVTIIASTSATASHTIASRRCARRTASAPSAPIASTAATSTGVASAATEPTPSPSTWNV